MAEILTEIEFCLNCEVAPRSAASLNYCDDCEYCDANARGLFGESSRRAWGRSELRARCFALKPGALAVLAPKRTEFGDYVVEVRVGGKRSESKSYFTDSIEDARATAHVMREDAKRHNAAMRANAAAS